MLYEPPLIVRMRGFAGFMDDAFVIHRSTFTSTVLARLHPAISRSHHFLLIFDSF
jgi:hypothetical protein